LAKPRALRVRARQTTVGDAEGTARRGCPHSPKVTEEKYALPSEVALARITDNFGYFYKIEMHPVTTDIRSQVEPLIN